MNAGNVGLIVSAVFSWSLAFVEGANVALSTVMQPAISGGGYVDGPVVAGETTLVNWTLHKITDCDGVNWRVWRGEDGFYLREALGQTSLPKTDNSREYDIETRIPDAAPAGDLLLTIDGVYTCPNRNLIEFSLGPVEIEVVE